MTNFCKHLRQGLSESESLRRAKLDMIHSKTPAYRFPYFWAPFVLTGSPR